MKNSEKHQLVNVFFLLLITVTVKWRESSIKSSTHNMTEAHCPVHTYTHSFLCFVLFLWHYTQPITVNMRQLQDHPAQTLSHSHKLIHTSGKPHRGRVGGHFCMDVNIYKKPEICIFKCLTLLLCSLAISLALCCCSLLRF